MKQTHLHSERMEETVMLYTLLDIKIKKKQINKGQGADIPKRQREKITGVTTLLL